MNVTPRSMGQVIEYVEKKQKALSICKEYGLNLDLLGEFFKFRAQGLQTEDIGQKLGIHRVTVSRYLTALRNIDDDDFNFLYDFTRRGIDSRKGQF